MSQYTPSTIIEKNRKIKDHKESSKKCSSQLHLKSIPTAILLVKLRVNHLFCQVFWISDSALFNPVSVEYTTHPANFFRNIPLILNMQNKAEFLRCILLKTFQDPSLNFLSETTLPKYIMSSS
jgi:hypothetical protein